MRAKAAGCFRNHHGDRGYVKLDLLAVISMLKMPYNPSEHAPVLNCNVTKDKQLQLTPYQLIKQKHPLLHPQFDFVIGRAIKAICMMWKTKSRTRMKELEKFLMSKNMKGITTQELKSFWIWIINSTPPRLRCSFFSV